MKFSSTKSVQTTFVAPQKPSIKTFFVIKVIISYDNFIAIDPMKKFGARFSFSDFHGKKFSQQQEPGLREKITENMIISEYSTDRVFFPILIIQNLPFRLLK